VDGADYNVERGAGRAPFKALLDIGLTRTTTGARIFGALKGACDGGLDVPHKDRRFPGSKREEGEWVADPEVHRKYIFGGHVKEYMEKLQGDDEEAYNRQFKRFVEAGIGADDLEGIYTEAHKSIRKDPNVKRAATQKGYFGTREGPASAAPEKKRWRRAAISLQQRKARIRQKLTARGVRSIKDDIAAFEKSTKNEALLPGWLPVLSTPALGGLPTGALSHVAPAPAAAAAPAPAAAASATKAKAAPPAKKGKDEEEEEAGGDEEAEEAAEETGGGGDDEEEPADEE